MARAVARFGCRLATLENARSDGPLQAVLPHAASTLLDLGWQMEPNGDAVSRVDDVGRTRRFCFGWQNMSVFVRIHRWDRMYSSM